MVRLPLVLLLLCGLALRGAEVHVHNGSAHSESCTACRVLHTPFVASDADEVLQPLVAAGPGQPLLPASALAPQSTLPGSLRLRAPPVFA